MRSVLFNRYALNWNRSPERHYSLTARSSLVSTSRIMTATISLLFLLVSTELAIPQNLAIGKHDLIEAADRVAGFRGVDVNRDDIAGLKRIPSPAQKAGRRRTPRFAGPVCDVAIVVFHVEHDDVMGIGPQELRHRGVFQYHDLVRVGRSSVMCEQGAAGRQNTYQQGETHQPLTFHSAPRELPFAV